MQRNITAPKGPVIGLQPLAFSPPASAGASTSDGAASAGSTVPPPAAAKPNVVKALSVRLKETYRKADPSRPEEIDAAPRRVLTQPSFPVGNGCAAMATAAHAFHAATRALRRPARVPSAATAASDRARAQHALTQERRPRGGPHAALHSGSSRSSLLSLSRLRLPPWPRLPRLLLGQTSSNAPWL